jgi:uncharacterized damage-inducible protein DinB
MLEMWEMGRTRLAALLPGVSDEVLAKRLHPRSNSVGWLLRHIGEIEQLFAKNVFGLEVQVKAYTLAGTLARDDHGTAADLIAFLEESAERLRVAITRQDEGSWNAPVTTAEFGTVSKQEALARVMTHTAYHAGQLALALKYGT